MSEVRIAAEPRTEFGKGAARRIRRDAKVPAVLYGHGTEPRHIALPGHELMLALKTPNVLLSVDLEGSTELALPKDVQRDPVKGFLEHVDLVLVRRGEKVVVDVPVEVGGEAESGTLVTVESATLQVEAEATHLPESFPVSVDGLAAGTQVLAGQVALPEGTTLAGDPEAVVVLVAAAPTAEQVDAELAEAEAGAGIVHEEKDADAGEVGAPEGAEQSGDAQG
ncbi:50S ribosomal protein L25/general stress protein Ctc [Vallicoccus soli]|uniref:Large ribosomal subunit protein bL25 n=1 Tax=Vallicoccus soli TaxID=2339232 RepID=A0A3A3ZMJ3_9ACTN|nr:50S ribosomal protein L25/general stress protein Ctc [Vallicoccus soli]RJK97861.1 50S ribosomal protein L25/general stress protein Ctc [Vallicoccus soli]